MVLIFPPEPSVVERVVDYLYENPNALIAGAAAAYCIGAAVYVHYTKTRSTGGKVQPSILERKVAPERFE